MKTYQDRFKETQEEIEQAIKQASKDSKDS